MYVRLEDAYVYIYIYMRYICVEITLLSNFSPRFQSSKLFHDAIDTRRSPINALTLNNDYEATPCARIDRARNPTCGLDNNVTLQRGIIRGYELYRPIRGYLVTPAKNFGRTNYAGLHGPSLLNRSLSRFRSRFSGSLKATRMYDLYAKLISKRIVGNPFTMRIRCIIARRK